MTDHMEEVQNGSYCMSLPSRVDMVRAFMERDPAYEGIFVTAVRTTGIFCRPTCSARKPKTENVEFFATTGEALFAGYRPCLRCRPMEPVAGAPDWLHPLLRALEENPSVRWRDRDVRAIGLEPDRVRRWFRRTHGMTFQAYNRARRLGTAMGRIQGGTQVVAAAFGNGYESLSGFNEAIRRMSGVPPGRASKRTVFSATRLSTPLGPMIACADERAVYLLEFSDRRKLETQFRTIQKRLDGMMIPRKNPLLDELSDQLEAYFAGRLTTFSVPVEAPGTEFQEQVWQALMEIPYGMTTSYGALAQKLGRPKAVRAVAGANGDNRIAIIIPCHRVVGKDGTLTGYGGGLWRKRRLLDIESRQLSLGMSLQPTGR